jgi:lysophospholipase L1-like esterase
MQSHRSRRLLLFGSLFIALIAYSSQAAGAQKHWIPTWTASPESAVIVLPGFARRPAGANSSAPANNRPLFPPPPPVENQTVRMVVRTSAGGSAVRVQLSNAFGPAPLPVGAVHIALQDKGSSIITSSDHVLTFSGQPSIVIPKGAEVLSDPVDMKVGPLAYLTISVYISGKAEDPTDHLTGLHTTYLSGTGDFTGAASIKPVSTRESWYWISAVDVLAPEKTGVIVAFGDSITDGATSTPNTDSSWPSQLDNRIQKDKALAGKWAVVHAGISGNQLLSDGMGVAALARLDRDVFSLTGVKWIIVLEGINDIGLSSLTQNPADKVTAQQLIDAQKQIIERAHLRGIKVMGATLTPFKGASYYSDYGEQTREAVNKWILTSGAFDATVDFDKVVQDPANPQQILPAFNISDHLHPNDAGYKAMADAINLSVFARSSK